LLWVSLNTLLIFIFDVSGNIIVILTGIPLIVGVVYNFRNRKIRQLLLQTINNTKNSVEALTQIAAIQQIIKSRPDVTLIGMVNLHVLFLE